MDFGSILKIFFCLQTQTNVYETVCELNANQNSIEQRLGELEEKLITLQVYS